MATPKAAMFRRMENNAQAEIWRVGHVTWPSPRGRVVWGVVSGSLWRAMEHAGADRWTAAIAG
eukprot:2124367-Pleurochrysis_carterae.AAC.1